MNEIEPTRIRLCSQKFATWKSLRLRSKNTSWCRIGKWHCLKTRRFKTPICILRHLRRIFLENLRVTAESAGALLDGANVVRTETRNYFCVRICYKFLISHCRGDWDLGLCTFWVRATREPLCKSDFRKKNVFRPQKKSDIAIAQRM